MAYDNRTEPKKDMDNRSPSGDQTSRQNKSDIDGYTSGKKENSGRTSSDNK